MTPRIESFVLPALQKTYFIRYLKSNITPGTVNFLAPAASTVLLVQCRDSLNPPRKALKDALREWLRSLAKTHISELLETLARENGFTPPSGIRIAFQRSRWGSCSTSGVISFSALTLFLPPELVRHVALHELCHTKHMNHGLAFQTLLTRFDPKTALYREQLPKAGNMIPEWIL